MQQHIMPTSMSIPVSSFSFSISVSSTVKLALAPSLPTKNNNNNNNKGPWPPLLHPISSSSRRIRTTTIPRSFRNIEDDFLLSDMPFYPSDWEEELVQDMHTSFPNKLLQGISTKKPALEPLRDKLVPPDSVGRNPSLLQRATIKSDGRTKLAKRKGNGKGKGRNWGVPSGMTWEERAYEIIKKQKLRYASVPVENKPQPKIANPSTPSIKPLLIKKTQVEKKDETVFSRLADKFNLKPHYQPLVEYFCDLGLQEEQLEKIAGIHIETFQSNINKVKPRLEFLTSVAGVKKEDLPKLIVKHPQILEYTVEKMIEPKIQYFQSLGVPKEKLGRIVMVCPSLFDRSLERVLKPRVKFLVEEVGVEMDVLWKVIVLSPYILIQNLQDSLIPRLDYLTQLGASPDAIAKIVTKHPQLLHYSIENKIERCIEFLYSIGLDKPEILKIMRRSPQIVSLSLENTLQPKYEYLTKELNCDGKEVAAKSPAYFSLSLNQRIKPRHMFLVSSKLAPSGPFPMRFLLATDDVFCHRWAKSTVEEYHAFRRSLSVTNMAKQFQHMNTLHLKV